MKSRLSLVLAALFVLPPSGPIFAQDSAKLGELERKVDVLTQEIEKLKLGEAADRSPRPPFRASLPPPPRCIAPSRIKSRSAATAR